MLMLFCFEIVWPFKNLKSRSHALLVLVNREITIKRVAFFYMEGLCAQFSEFFCIESRVSRSWKANIFLAWEVLRIFFESSVSSPYSRLQNILLFAKSRAMQWLLTLYTGQGSAQLIDLYRAPTERVCLFHGNKYGCYRSHGQRVSNFLPIRISNSRRNHSECLSNADIITTFQRNVVF